MPSYSCYFLDAADHVTHFNLIECEADPQAQVRADRKLAASRYPGIELWDCERRVYRAQKVANPATMATSLDQRIALLESAADDDSLVEIAEPLAKLRL